MAKSRERLAPHLAHLRLKLKLREQPKQLELFEQATIQPAMVRFASFLGLPAEGRGVHNDLLFKASTASTTSAPHENGREYIADAPPDVAASLTAFPPSCPSQAGKLTVPPILAGLHKLESRVKSLPNGVPIVQGFVEETMAARAGTGAQAAGGKAQTA
mgnify:CR=1 FL=1